VGAPVFGLLTELAPRSRAWADARRDAQCLADGCAAALGFRPKIQLVSTPPKQLARGLPTVIGSDTVTDAGCSGLQRQLSELAGQTSDVFLLPTSLEFGLWERETLSEARAMTRREIPGAALYYDDVDPGHAMVAQAFSDQALRALPAGAGSLGQLGVLLVARGDGDLGSRAQAYRLMRLLWEQLGAARGEVAFLRHSNPFLREALENVTADGLPVIVVPLMQWDDEPLDHLRVIFADHLRAHPEARQRCYLAQPPGPHPCLRSWMRQRLLSLWGERRRAAERREPSAKRRESGPARRLGTYARDGVVAEVRDTDELRALLPQEILDAERVFVKVTWHGYAPGTYTDPVALDSLLTALPGRVTLLEGHTSSRNLAAVDWDWEIEAKRHRRWIREQEAEYLRRTGLTEVIERHGARYVNVTECFWDGQCAPQREIEQRLQQRGVALTHPRLAGFVPEALLEHAGAPLLSFGRFKGPTRLSLSNLFGLIPDPLRSEWHGPNITHLAQVCCDLARLYGVFFPIYGIVEGLHSAVRWDRRGLYRSRWGNYDLIANPGLAVLSEGVVAADALASRLQGQDVRRSAFFDVVARELGLAEELCERPLPQEWLRKFA